MFNYVYCYVLVILYFICSFKVNTTTVEIDESLFGKKAKYHRGRHYKNVWVFGMVERQTRKLSMHVVGDRRKTTLMPILEKHVDKRAKIFHDDWASYRDLESYGYDHATVNHSKEFVSPDGTCTNTIEGIWGLIKSRIKKMHGISNPNQTQDYLDEFVYRYMNRYTLWSQFFTDVAHKFTV